MKTTLFIFLVPEFTIGNKKNKLLKLLVTPTTKKSRNFFNKKAKKFEKVKRWIWHGDIEREKVKKKKKSFGEAWTKTMNNRIRRSCWMIFSWMYVSLLINSQRNTQKTSCTCFQFGKFQAIKKIWWTLKSFSFEKSTFKEIPKFLLVFWFWV